LYHRHGETHAFRLPAAGQSHLTPAAGLVAFPLVAFPTAAGDSVSGSDPRTRDVPVRQ
jgi:hypothetical protein